MKNPIKKTRSNEASTDLAFGAIMRSSFFDLSAEKFFRVDCRRAGALTSKADIFSFRLAWSNK